MIVLQPVTTAQGYVVTQRLTDTAALPRANRLQLIDEETQAVRTITIAGTTAGDYYDTVTITINPALKEGHTYKAIMYYNSIANKTWRGKIFCTAQITTSLGFNDVRDYSVQDGKYTENTANNEFIFND